MIKQTVPKPIVFDKELFFKNLHNWELVDDGFCGLEYDGDGTMYHEFNVDYKVGEEEVSVWVEICHTWSECNDPGDYWTPPSCEVYNENTEVYIMQVCVDGVETCLSDDLLNRLEYLINDTVVNY